MTFIHFTINNLENSTMKKITTSFAIGAALISSVTNANSFGVTELSSGYMQLAAADEKSTEMACGANMKMDTPAPKTAEGACASKKTDAKDSGKTAADKAASDAAKTEKK